MANQQEPPADAYRPDCTFDGSVPPQTYGGTERVVSYLTEELVAMGHDVTLFASGRLCNESETGGGAARALRLDRDLRDAMAPVALHVERVCQMANEFDILHNHLDYWPFSLLNRQPTPYLTTLHGRLDIAELISIYDCFDDVPLISISHAQRRPFQTPISSAPSTTDCPRTCCRQSRCGAATLRFSAASAPKSLPTAPSASPAGRRPLKIAAKVDRVDHEYYETAIRPMIDGKQIEMIGEIGEPEKAAFLSGATAC